MFSLLTFVSLSLSPPVGVCVSSAQMRSVSKQADSLSVCSLASQWGGGALRGGTCVTFLALKVRGAGRFAEFREKTWLPDSSLPCFH